MVRKAIYQTFQNKSKYALDSLPTQLALFTLKKLSKYQTKCVRVRRSSDNTAIDIGFDSSGVVDKALVQAFANSSQVFVEKWYSSNNFEISQTNPSNQPELIYSTPTPFINFVNNSSLLGGVPNGFTNSDDFSLVFRHTEIVRQPSCLFSFTSTNTSRILAHAAWSDGVNYFDLGDPIVGSPNGRISNLSPTPVGTSQIIEFTNRLSGSQAILVNGAISASSGGFNGSIPTKFNIGYENFLLTGITARISSILLFSKQLNTDQRNTVNSII